MRNNTINNIEFPAKDLEKLERFYSTVFGWKFTSFGDDYIEFNDGWMTGGFNKNLERKSDGPLVIIYSDNLEKKLEDILTAGGKISNEIISFPGGRRFQFTDVEGNELAVWSDK